MTRREEQQMLDSIDYLLEVTKENNRMLKETRDSRAVINRANFAHNASNWHADGGFLNPDDQIPKKMYFCYLKIGIDKK